MTDKQIIIDVTQCPYYKKDTTCTYLPYKTKCEGDCNWTSYKEIEEQLKRSEAQCEAMFVTHTDLEKAYKAKEQECEELKKIINEAKNSKLDLNSFFAIEATVGEYQLELDQLKADRIEALKQLEFVRTLNTVQEAEIRKYSKTLTEIKEIAKNGCYDDCGMPLDELSIILQKISECEVK